MQDYANHKINQYRHVFEHDLRNAGIACRAEVLTQEGRPGRDAREVINGLCKHLENMFLDPPSLPSDSASNTNSFSKYKRAWSKLAELAYLHQLVTRLGCAWAYTTPYLRHP